VGSPGQRRSSGPVDLRWNTLSQNGPPPSRATGGSICRLGRSCPGLRPPAGNHPRPSSNPAVASFLGAETHPPLTSETLRNEYFPPTSMPQDRVEAMVRCYFYFPSRPPSNWRTPAPPFSSARRGFSPVLVVGLAKHALSYQVWPVIFFFLHGAVPRKVPPGGPTMRIARRPRGKFETFARNRWPKSRRPPPPR